MANNLLKKISFSVAGMYAVNRLIDFQVKNLSKRQHTNGKIYKWKEGDIFYTEKGTSGTPIVLIHNLGHRSASYEWDELIRYLSKEHIVYAVDLPGCGRSVKPQITYTSYFYVQFLRDFCKDIVGNKSILISSGDSYSFSIMCSYLYPELFDKIILLNPNEVDSGKNITGITKLAYKNLLQTPVVGTCIYNLENFSYNAFRKVPLENKFSENSLSHTVSAYIASHLGGGNGKFLRASKINNYTSVNIHKQLKELNNITILLSKNKKNHAKVADSFCRINPHIEIKRMNVHGEFPQMNHPNSVYIEIKEIIK